MTTFPHSIDIIPGALLFVVADQMGVSYTRRIARTVQILDENPVGGFYELVPGYASILVMYDETVTSFQTSVRTLQEAWDRAAEAAITDESHTVTIDVVYGDTFGEDLTKVAEYTGLSVDEVITLHASAEYTVGAVGFSPGFTYLIGLPEVLSVPRRPSPRLRVPSGSVGIGGNQTGVYALESAGGWNLIGRSPTTLFDPSADDPVRLKLGDTVRFRPISNSSFPGAGEVTPCGDGPVEIVAPGMHTSLQDLGRFGYGRSGFATDGAADRSALVAANRLVGNPDGVAGLECTLQGPHLRFHRRLRFGITGADLGARLNGRPVRPGRTFETMPGDELTFRRDPGAHGARAYISVAAGFDVPLVLGSASTNLTAQIGGWQGWLLMAGDRLDIGQQHLAESPILIEPVSTTTNPTVKPYRVIPGPQRDRFDDACWHRLISEPFTVSDEANRVGIRLIGPDLSPCDTADVLSEGIVTGSIQVTNGGQAIVMLPGHATIGGYTKIATVHPHDWDRLGQLSPGDQIRFEEVSRD